MGNKLRHEGDEVRIKVIWPDVYIYIYAYTYVAKDLANAFNKRPPQNIHVGFANLSRK